MNNFSIGIRVLSVIGLVATTSIAGTYLGKVYGNAYEYTDVENGGYCCSLIKDPKSASRDLMNACYSLDGSYTLNARFSSSVYCGIRSNYGGGYKYYCSKQVEADCYD